MCLECGGLSLVGFVVCGLFVVSGDWCFCQDFGWGGLLCLLCVLVVCLARVVLCYVRVGLVC